MSYFRAINRPWDSPLERIPRERPLSDVVSGQRCETDGGQASALSPMLAVVVTPNADEATRRDFPKVILPAKELRISPKRHPRLPTKSSTGRAWAAVVPTDTQSCGQSKDRGDIEKAVAKAKKTTHTPGTEKRNSKSSKSKARRQQAPRETKLIPSIEQSARKRIASYSSDCGTNGANESEYRPSTAELADTTHSSTASSPSRRNPRKHSSAYPSADPSAIAEITLDIASLQPSPRTDGTLAVVKREKPTAVQSLPNPKSPATPRPPSPSIWSSQLRRKRYEEADFVELPREMFEYFETKKDMRQLLALKKEVMRAEKRKEKGKLADLRSVEETRESTQKTGKRKHEEEVEQKEPRKRRKLQESQKPGEANRSLTDNGIVFSEGPQTSSARRSPRGKTPGIGVQRYKSVVVKAEDRSDVVDVRSHAGIEARSHASGGFKDQDLQCSLGSQAPEEPLGQTHDQASRHRKKQRVPLNDDWRKPYERREMSVPRSCSCALLPEYFTRNPSYVPRLATWRGGRLEFLEHVKQISCCRGSIHPPNVIDACRRMLRKYDYPNRGDEQSLESMFEFHGFPSGNDRNDDHSGRAQSSIAPPTFYGHSQSYSQSYRIPQHVGSSSHSAQTASKMPRSLGSLCGPERVPPPKGTLNKPMLRKTPMVHERVKDTMISTNPSIDQHPSSAVIDDAGSCPALPLSSPSGKRCGAVTPNLRVPDDPTSEKETAAARPISKAPPEPPCRPSEPQASFGARRQRHQSAPVDSARRHTTINDHKPPPQPPPRRHERVLQAISNDAILHLMNRRVASLEKLLTERLPAQTPPTPTQTPTLPTAPAPTPAPRSDAADAATEPRRRRRKKPSRAQRQLQLPRLDRDVPAHLRLPDRALVDVGRIARPYERHARAPYAFGWGGRLYADYKHLLTRRGDGLPGWTAEEMFRLR